MAGKKNRGASKRGKVSQAKILKDFLSAADTTQQKSQKNPQSTMPDTNPTAGSSSTRQNDTPTVDPFFLLEDLDVEVDADEANMATASGRGRKRARTRVSDAIRVFDNNTAEMQERAFAFTVLVDVSVLNPDWGIGHGANRPLILSHVDDLVMAFNKEGVSRFDLSHRLKASVPSATVEEILASLSEDETARIHSGRASVNRQGIFHLTWSNQWPRPILQAGQHRRAALLKRSGLSPDTISAPSELIEASVKLAPEQVSKYMLTLDSNYCGLLIFTRVTFFRGTFLRSQL